MLNSGEAELGMPEATKQLCSIQGGVVPKAHGAYFVTRNHTASTSLSLRRLSLPSLGFEDSGVKPSLAIDSLCPIDQVAFRYFLLDGKVQLVCYHRHLVHMGA